MKIRRNSNLKRIAALMLTLIMAFGIAAVPGLSMTASAEGTEYTQGVFTYRIDTAGDEVGAIIKSCSKTASGNIVIPEKLGGYEVVGIDQYAFLDCALIKSVYIPQCVKNIGISSNFATESTQQFNQYIKMPVFSGCTSLEKIEVSEQNSAYCSDNGVLFTKDKTVLIQYPAGKKQTEYTVPQGVTTISSVYIMSAPTVIKDVLKSLVSAKGESPFNNSQVEKIFVSNTVETLMISNSEKIKYINVADDNPNFSSVDGVLFNKEKTELLLCPAGNPRTSYSVPNGVEKIASGAFDNSKNLKKVEIPASVTSCCHFKNCPAIEEFAVSPDNKDYISRNGVLLWYYGDEGYKTLRIYQYPSAKKDKIYEIDEDIIYIDSGAFFNCSNIESLIIPVNTNCIWDNFSGCDNIKNVYYKGTEEQWKEISTDKMETNSDYQLNSYFKNATIHYNYTPVHTHTPSPIHIAPTCTVNGMDYTVCAECGETIGESTVLPATGHKWGAWKTTVAATTAAEGKQERTCTACGAKETKAVPRLEQVVTDKQSGIEVVAPSGSYDGKLTLEVEEIFDGESFNVIEAIPGGGKSQIYDVTTKINGEPAQPDKPVTVKIPLPAGYDPAKTYVYHINSETGAVEDMHARYDNGYMVFETTHFSVYSLVEKKTLVSIEIVSLPEKLTYTYKSETSTEGLKVAANYSDGSQEDITDYVNVTGFEAKTKKQTGEKTATVEFEGLTATFTYTVKYAWWQHIIRILLLGFIWYDL